MGGKDESLFEFKGERTGTTLLVIGGTHGNEGTGIRVVERLKDECESGRLSVAAGTLRLALGNPVAITEGTRHSAGGFDLNRAFTDSALNGEAGAYEAKRARELAGVIRTSDIVIDLHSTQLPTATPFISSKIDAEHERVYRWFAGLAPTMIEDPEYVLAGEPASVDEYADRMGKVGVCIESGYMRDVSVVEQVVESVMGVMADFGLVNKQVAASETKLDCFHWEESIPYDPALGWTWAPGVTVRSFEAIPKGAVIGYAGTEAVTRPYDAFLLFPKDEEGRREEGRVTYLARRLDTAS